MPTLDRPSGPLGRSDRAMNAINSQLTAIFTGSQTSNSPRSGDDWSISTVERDVARLHRLCCGPASCALRGVSAGPGKSLTAHVIFVRSGEVQVGQWGHGHLLAAGDIFVSCSWLPLSLEVPDALEALIVELPAWWAISRFMDRTQVLPDLYVNGGFFAAPLIQQMAQAVFDLEAGDQGVGRGLDMMADMMRSALAACFDASKAMPKVLGRMGGILRFIVEKIDQPGLSAQDAAAALKCSVRTIYKTCASYGTSFNGLLTEMRLVTAEYQLLRSDERVSQIAYAVGFASLSHFSRLFRARFGIPAKTYRRLRGASSAH